MFDNSSLKSILINLLKRCKSSIIHVALNIKGHSLDKVIIIFSEPRSGSTWLLEMLHSIIPSVVQWEPINPVKGLAPKYFNWGWRPHIAENVKNQDEIKDWLEKVLTHRVSNFWSQKFIPISEIFKINRSEWVITKFVRANHLLNWILANIELQIQPIILMRHPIATAISRIKTFGTDSLNDLRHNPLMRHPRLRDEARYIESLKTEMEKQVAFWCINFGDIIENQALKSKCHFLFYEQLLLEPERQLSLILNKIGINTIEIPSYIYMRASKTDYNEDLQKPELQIEKWIDEIEENDQIRIQAVLDHFDITIYNAYTAYPLV